MLKDKNVKAIIIYFVAMSLMLSGCITKQETTNNKENEKITIFPVYSNATKSTYTNDTLWVIMNVSLDLNRTYYETNTEIEDIIDWYLTEENIGEYNIKKGDEHGGASIISTSNIDPNNASYGYVKLNKNNETEGLFVFIIKGLEEMQLEKKYLMGIATGPWDKIIICEKTGNITEVG